MSAVVAHSDFVTTEQTYSKNIKLVYGYSFFQMFLVSIPVLVPYWKNSGLNISEIFLLQGIFGAVLIVFDLPAGYVADLFGRKKTMLLGSVITALGYQVLWLGTTFIDFAVFEIVVGIGLSLQSGCDVANSIATFPPMECPRSEIFESSFALQ